MSHLTILIFACSKCGQPVVHPVLKYDGPPNVEAEYDPKLYQLKCRKPECGYEDGYYGRDKVELAQFLWPHLRMC